MLAAILLPAQIQDFLPVAGDYPGLVPLGKRTTYTLDANRQEYLGKNGIIFENYDLVDFFHNEYTLDGAKNYLNIESYSLAGDNGAAGNLLLLCP